MALAAVVNFMATMKKRERIAKERPDAKWTRVKSFILSSPLKPPASAKTVIPANKPLVEAMAKGFQETLLTKTPEQLQQTAVKSNRKRAF
jgi:hypothetical protein